LQIVPFPAAIIGLPWRRQIICEQFSSLVQFFCLDRLAGQADLLEISESQPTILFLTDQGFLPEFLIVCLACLRRLLTLLLLCLRLYLLLLFFCFMRPPGLFFLSVLLALCGGREDVADRGHGCSQHRETGRRGRQAGHNGISPAPEPHPFQAPHWTRSNWL